MLNSFIVVLFKVNVGYYKQLMDLNGLTALVIYFQLVLGLVGPGYNHSCYVDVLRDYNTTFPEYELHHPLFPSLTVMNSPVL